MGLLPSPNDHAENSLERIPCDNKSKDRWCFRCRPSDHEVSRGMTERKYGKKGWGGPVGYVYQKANVEFFCSKEKLNALIEKCKAFPSLTYTGVNKEGSWISNVSSQTDANAVTWGVFPAKEIIQPTVVDPSSFIVWKDEPFEIWSRGWAQLYPEGDHPESCWRRCRSATS